MAAQGKNFGIVVSQFNDFITKRLLEGCLKEFSRLGVKKTQLTVVNVPGAFEIPLAALKLAQKKKISAVICLGSVIRGETIHFELVAKAAADGAQQAALMTGKPVIFGVLATETIEQAQKRSNSKGDNKGASAARDAVTMLDMIGSLR